MTRSTHPASKDALTEKEKQEAVQAIKHLRGVYEHVLAQIKKLDSERTVLVEDSNRKQRIEQITKELEKLS